jgi:hypothetical protein
MGVVPTRVSYNEIRELRKVIDEQRKGAAGKDM